MAAVSIHTAGYKGRTTVRWVNNQRLLLRWPYLKPVSITTSIWNILMKFCGCKERYKLHILVFELSALDICEKKITFAKVLLWDILIKFYAVKNTKAKSHYSGHLNS